MRERVRGARSGRLATVDAQGRPHLVPFCFALAADTLYSAVDEKPKRSKRLKRLDNIRANANVSVLVDHYEEDWSHLWWVRLDGLAFVVDGPEERGRAIRLLQVKYAQYRHEPPAGPVFGVRIHDWRGWSPSKAEAASLPAG